jgi:hypothetical protein
MREWDPYLWSYLVSPFALRSLEKIGIEKRDARYLYAMTSPKLETSFMNYIAEHERVWTSREFWSKNVL